MTVLRDLGAVGRTAVLRTAPVLVSGGREEPVEPLDGRHSLAVEHVGQEYRICVSALKAAAA